MSLFGRLRSVMSPPQPERCPVPPPDLVERGAGAGDYEAIGREFLRIFTEVGGLQPFERVLDIGCGAGRMAAALIPYLRSGSYEGFDVLLPAVNWCQANLQPLHPRFGFRHVDLRNDTFNPAGTIDPVGFRFPYPEAEFDFVFLTSVFTHMFAPETRNYFGEIGRVLKPGGRMLATFFLLDEETVRLVQAGRTSVPFQQEWEHGAIAYPELPGKAVAYWRSWVEQTLPEVGLRLEPPVRLGSWCDRSETLTYQDVVLAVKPEQR